MGKTKRGKPLMFQFKLVGQIAVFNVGGKLIALEATSLFYISLNAAFTLFDLSITVLSAWSCGLMAKLHVLLCFSPWPDKPLRMANVMIITIGCTSERETFGPKGLLRECLEEPLIAG